MKNLCNNRGGAIVIVMLILLPFLLITSINMNEERRLAGGSNINLKSTVEMAAKSAAMGVTEQSQANGTPMIDYSMAHENFKRILIRNLALNEDMTPKEKSIVKNVNYYLLICNGTNSFGLKEGYIISFKDGMLATQELSTGNLPKSFGVNENFDINGEGPKVNLDKPGVIAIIEAEITPAVVMPKGEKTKRWAAAKII